MHVCVRVSHLSDASRCDISAAASCCPVVASVCGHQRAAVLWSRLWTDHHVENPATERRGQRLLAPTDAAFPQQHPLHQSAAECEFTQRWPGSLRTWLVLIIYYDRSKIRWTNKSLELKELYIQSWLSSPTRLLLIVSAADITDVNKDGWEVHTLLPIVQKQG